MSSATTSVATAASTSPAAPPTTSPKPDGPSKLAVVPRPQPLIAVRSATGGGYELADGRHVTCDPTDWLICRGKVIIDVVADKLLRDRYQIVETGALTLSLADCVRLESTIGVGNAQSTTKLLPAVERLARIEIGTIKIDFTPGQLEEIALRAKKRGQTVEQSLQAVIDRIREELFWRS